MKTLLTLIGLLIGFAMTQVSAVELKPDDKAVVAKGKSVYKSQCAAGGALAFVNTLALSDDSLVIWFEFNRAHLGHGEPY